jgi:transposase-like protein
MKPKSAMKPTCPKCGSNMTLVAAKSRSGAPAERTTYCCEPCTYVFSEAASSAIVERAMLLDLEASRHFGTMH